MADCIAIQPTEPRAAPAAVSAAAREATIRKMRVGAAPSAMRTPIPLRLAATAEASTP